MPIVEFIHQSDPERSRRVQVTASQRAYEILKQHWNMHKIELVKQIKILLLTNSNQVLGIFEIASGSMDNAIFDQKFIFSAALLAGAGIMILGNNNTSGTLTPSAKDKRTTEALVLARRIMGIEALDHIIFCKEGYFSFVDNGLITAPDE